MLCCIRDAILKVPSIAARPLAGPVHVGAVQGTLAYALHRLRPLPPAEHDGRMADHGQYADRGDLLCAIRRPRHDAHPIVRHVQAVIQGEGLFIYFIKMKISKI